MLLSFSIAIGGLFALLGIAWVIYEITRSE